MATVIGGVRWGVVGAGTISTKVVPHHQNVADVVAVFSRDRVKADAFARSTGIDAVYDDYAVLLAATDIDAVYIATPFALHFEMARAALLAGKHVLVEKPMAMDARQVADLFALAAARRLFLMEAMWMKFNPAFRYVAAEVAAGRIGEPRSIRASFGMPIPDDGGSKWDPARSGGALLDQGIYPVALAHALFGRPARVQARGRVRVDGLDLEEHFTLEYADGRYATGASSMTEFLEPSATVSGTRGWITMAAPFWAGSTVLVHGGSWEGLFDRPERLDLGREGNGYVAMAVAVNEAIDAGLVEHPLHTGSDTVDVFHTLDLIRSRISSLTDPTLGAP